MLAQFHVSNIVRNSLASSSIPLFQLSASCPPFPAAAVFCAGLTIVECVVRLQSRSSSDLDEREGQKGEREREREGRRKRGREEESERGIHCLIILLTTRDLSRIEKFHYSLVSLPRRSFSSRVFFPDRPFPNKRYALRRQKRDLCLATAPTTP